MIKNSLAFRLPLLYKSLLRYRRLHLPQKSSSDVTVLMMTGKNYIELLRYSVWSIGKAWERLPKLIISTDGTISTSEIAKELKFWKGELILQSWEESINYHGNKIRPGLIEYANNQAFGKKLALILHHAEKGPVLWIDSDILFFNDFTRFLPKPESGICCGGSEDWITAYHQLVLNCYNERTIVKNFNAGLLYVSGEKIYEKFGIEQTLMSVHPHYDFFTEQTIFAHIASYSMGVLWNKDVIKNFNEDRQNIMPMQVKDVIARHYTSNVRHLFWRDCLFNMRALRK